MIKDSYCNRVLTNLLNLCNVFKIFHLFTYTYIVEIYSCAIQTVQKKMCKCTEIYKYEILPSKIYILRCLSYAHTKLYQKWFSRSFI